MKSSPRFRNLILSPQRILHYLLLSIEVMKEWGFNEWARRVRIKISGTVSDLLPNLVRDNAPITQYSRLRPQNVEGRKTILVVEARMLTPDRDSGSHRMWEILKLLKEFGHSVTFATTDLEFREPYVSQLRNLGIEVITSRDVTSIETYIQYVGPAFDMIILSRVIVASRLMEWVRLNAANAKVIFDTVDLHFLREQRHSRLNQSQGLLAQAEALRREELDSAEKADITLVVSSAEKEILERIASGLRIEVLSNIHTLKGTKRPFSEREQILFLGGFEHAPNIDAVQFYVKEILPLLRKRIEGVKTFIVGSDPPVSVMALAEEDVVITGYVKELSPFFTSCRVFIAPIRYGAGVKGKVNMSMSYGLPVVGTSVALEGIGINATDGVDEMLADDPTVFAEKVVAIYNNEELWKKLSANGLENVRKHFSPEVAKAVLKRILQ